MLFRVPVKLIENPICTQRVEGLTAEDFRYYDKDGFELNKAEQKFYEAMSYPLDQEILNHRCWQETFYHSVSDSGVFIDHAMILHRAHYSAGAKRQLEELKAKWPLADLLLRTKRKWGYDIAIDYLDTDGTIYEIFHIEYDDYNYQSFVKKLGELDTFIQSTDWDSISKEVIARKAEWQNLPGMKQTDWKTKFILGWDQSEYTLKSI